MAACVTDAVAAQDAGKQIDELVDIFDKMTARIRFPTI